jgi:hypothetical protein
LQHPRFLSNLGSIARSAPYFSILRFSHRY